MARERPGSGSAHDNGLSVFFSMRPHISLSGISRPCAPYQA